jgi:hypothetical protein
MHYVEAQLLLPMLLLNLKIFKSLISPDNWNNTFLNMTSATFTYKFVLFRYVVLCWYRPTLNLRDLGRRMFPPPSPALIAQSVWWWTAGWMAKEWGFVVRQGQIICLPPIERVPGVKRPGREAGYSLQFSVGVKNGGAIPLLPHTF